MTGSEDRLMTARRGIERLGPGKIRIQDFLAAQLRPEGGFSGRSPASDLYYTAFGLDCLAALGHAIPFGGLSDYVARFGTGADLDFMHLISLARCWARISPEPAMEGGRGAILLDRLVPYACAGGGYNTVTGATQASATANYLAAAVYHDLGIPLPDVAGLLRSLSPLRTADGAYANLPGLASGTALATAGVLTLHHTFNQPVDWPAAQWLMDQFCEEGGCLATPGAPVPDVLSTATALFAFQSLGVDTSGIAPACLAFVDSLQQPGGGYGGHRLDTTADCEYTFYALMTMGCLWETGI